jgi:hypothetical protein
MRETAQAFGLKGQALVDTPDALAKFIPNAEGTG